MHGDGARQPHSGFQNSQLKRVAFVDFIRKRMDQSQLHEGNWAAWVGIGEPINSACPLLLPLF
jgi:hypothetical protein